MIAHFARQGSLEARAELQAIHRAADVKLRRREVQRRLERGLLEVVAGKASLDVE